MRVTYDPQADAIYIELRAATVHETRDVTPTMLLDVDVEGKPVGIELLFVTRLDGADPMTLAFQVLGGAIPAKAAA